MYIIRSNVAQFVSSVYSASVFEKLFLILPFNSYFVVSLRVLQNENRPITHRCMS